MLKTVISAAALALTLGATASAGDHSDLMRGVQSLKPFGAFNVVVGDARFAGYFIPGPDRCDVRVAQHVAGDDTIAPRRMVLQIAAGGRSELEAGPDAALAIACSDDARALKVAPQNRVNAARL